LTVVTVVKLKLGNDNWGLETLVAAALFANQCFCAAPILEGYLSLIGFHRTVVRYLIFAIGTLLAILGAIHARPSDFGIPLH
jgi:hypothetical protein